jgi:hypothetical protein
MRTLSKAMHPLFVVECRNCRRSLVTTARITDREIAVLVAHIRACPASEPLRDAPMLGDILALVRVRQQALPGARDRV